MLQVSCKLTLYGPLQDVIFQWLTTNDIQLNNIDAEDPEVLYCKLINCEVVVVVVFFFWGGERGGGS